MKKPILLFLLIFIVVFGVFMSGCQKSSSPTAVATAGPTDDSKLKIKGSFNNVSSTGVSSLEAVEVAKVIVFNNEGQYSISNVTDGSFEVSTDKDKPVGMVFADVSNHYVGYLTLSNGVESLPLNSLGDGVSSINLGALSFTASAAEPSHNPLGSEIPISASDISAYAFSNGTFASLVNNPDVDGNGTIDVLEDVFYRYFIMYGVAGGTFNGTDLTPTINSPVTIKGYRLTVVIANSSGIYPATIGMQGTVGSGIESTSSEINNIGTMNSSYTMAWIEKIPPAGNYIASYDSTTLTFAVPDQSNIIKYQALALPTVILNGDDTIHEINWVYKLSDGSATIDPRVLIDKLLIEINGSAATQLYNSPTFTTDITDHILTNQTIAWSDVTSISMAYNDIFGNHIVVDYIK